MIEELVKAAKGPCDHLDFCEKEDFFLKLSVCYLIFVNAVYYNRKLVMSGSTQAIVHEKGEKMAINIVGLSIGILTIYGVWYSGRLKKHLLSERDIDPGQNPGH